MLFLYKRSESFDNCVLCHCKRDIYPLLHPSPELSHNLLSLTEKNKQHNVLNVYGGKMVTMHACVSYLPLVFGSHSIQQSDFISSASKSAFNLTLSNATYFFLDLRFPPVVLLDCYGMSLAERQELIKLSPF